MIEVGLLEIRRPRWRLKFWFTTKNFQWIPCEVESGKSSPGEFFDSWSDEYWGWGWLCFELLFARVLV